MQAPLTVLTGLLLDQPHLRALLSLIWDSGGSVLYVDLTTEPAGILGPPSSQVERHVAEFLESGLDAAGPDSPDNGG